MKVHFIKQKILVSIIMISSLFSLFTLSSCSKDDITDNDLSSKDSYYVRYKISSKYPYIFSNWSVSTPNGVYSKNGYQTRNWEQTYGPVKKGFKCEAKVQNGTYTIEIYVSKNQEAFSLKATKGSAVSYTIDF